MDILMSTGMIPLESIDVMIDCIYLYLLVLNHLHNIKYLQ